MNTELSDNVAIKPNTYDAANCIDENLVKFLIQAHKLRIAITKANIQVNTLEKDILETTFLEFCSVFDSYLKSIHMKIA